MHNPYSPPPVIPLPPSISNWIHHAAPARPIWRDETGIVNPSSAVIDGLEERAEGSWQLREHLPFPAGPALSQSASSITPNGHHGHPFHPHTWSSHPSHPAQSSSSMSNGTGENGARKWNGHAYFSPNGQTTSRDSKRTSESIESASDRPAMSFEEEEEEDIEGVGGPIEETGTFQRKRRRSGGQATTVTAEEIETTIGDAKGKSPRKKPSREDSSGLKVDYLAIQQNYAKLLTSLPSMFESGSTTSSPEISIDALKAITEMALLGHSLFIAPPAITPTSPISSGRTIASPEQISGDEKEKEATVPIQSCLGCQATDTPEWRRGPLGPRTLCNACGLVFAKLVRKRARAAKDAAGVGMSAPVQMSGKVSLSKGGVTKTKNKAK